MLMDKLSIWTGNTPIRRWLLSRVTKKYYCEYFNELKDKVVLEIGCGSGGGTKMILKYFSPKRIVATDLDPRQIALSKKNINNERVNFEIADATKLNYHSNSFDAVFDYGVIHHIPSPEWKKCLNEIHRVLKPKGLVFLYDLPEEAFDTIWGKIIKLFTIHPYDKMYRKGEFINCLKSIGFRITKRAEEMRYFLIVAKKQ